MDNDRPSPRRETPQAGYLDPLKLKERRKAAGLTQGELAARLGANATQGRVAHWEAGDDNPSIETVAKLSRELGCEMHELMHADGVKALAELAQVIQRAHG